MAKEELQQEHDQPVDSHGSLHCLRQEWNTSQLQAEFEVHGFMAPFVTVTRKEDNKKGTIQFQHSPRLYFGFVED